MGNGTPKSQETKLRGKWTSTWEATVQTTGLYDSSHSSQYPVTSGTTQGGISNHEGTSSVENVLGVESWDMTEGMTSPKKSA